MAGTASSRSASLSTITQFLPPISATTRLRCLPPAGTSAAVRMISRPTGPLPVNAIVATSRWRTSAAPAVPSPGRSAIAPGGTPPSRKARTTMSPHAGDCSAGFSTTVVPVARAAAGLPRRGHADRDRDREVPRRDHADDAARAVVHLVALAGDLEELLAGVERD